MSHGTKKMKACLFLALMIAQWQSWMLGLQDRSPNLRLMTKTSIVYTTIRWLNIYYWQDLPTPQSNFLTWDKHKKSYILLNIMMNQFMVSSGVLMILDILLLAPRTGRLSSGIWVKLVPKSKLKMREMVQLRCWYVWSYNLVYPFRSSV